MGMGMGMKLAAARAPASLDDPEFTSVAGAAALMMVSEETIRKMLTRKRLKRYKFGGHIGQGRGTPGARQGSEVREQRPPGSRPERAEQVHV